MLAAFVSLSSSQLNRVHVLGRMWKLESASSGSAEYYDRKELFKTDTAPKGLKNMRLEKLIEIVL